MQACDDNKLQVLDRLQKWSDYLLKLVGRQELTWRRSSTQSLRSHVSWDPLASSAGASGPEGSNANSFGSGQGTILQGVSIIP